MNKTLEYIYNHPKETKRIIGISYEQLTKLIEHAQKIEEEKKEEIAKRMFEKFISGVINQPNLLNIIRIIPT